MCDIALVYSQWLCFIMEMDSISGMYLMGSLQRVSFQSAEMNTNSILVWSYRKVNAHETHHNVWWKNVSKLSLNTKTPFI